MAINLGFVTQSPFFAESFTLTQYAAGSYDSNDEWQSGSATTYSLSGSVSAMGTGATRQNSEAGERSFENIKISCDRSVIARALRISLPAKGDTITYNNKEYLVTSVEDWRGHNLLDIYATIKNLVGS